MDQKRQYERYPCDFEIGIITRDGHVYTSKSYDISEQGLLVSLSQAALTNLEKTGVTFEQGEELRVSLSNNEKTMEFVILTKIAHTHYSNEGELTALGLHFEDKRLTLKHFISGLLKQFQ